MSCDRAAAPPTEYGNEQTAKGPRLEVGSGDPDAGACEGLTVGMAVDGGAVVGATVTTADGSGVGVAAAEGVFAGGTVAEGVDGADADAPDAAHPVRSDAMRNHVMISDRPIAQLPASCP